SCLKAKANESEYCQEFKELNLSELVKKPKSFKKVAISKLEKEKAMLEEQVKALKRA
ncbi:1532_t:CDS:2, partial [Dentiscutata heterogama]